MIIDWNAKSYKELRAHFNDYSDNESSDDESNPPYDYSEDIAFICLKNPNDKIIKNVLRTYPICAKYCGKLKNSILNYACSSSYSARFLVDRLSDAQKIKVAMNDVSSLEFFSLPPEELDKIFHKYAKAGMPQVTRYIIPHCPEKIHEYIHVDQNSVYALTDEQLTDEFIDRYIEIAPAQILYAMNQTRITSDLAMRAVKANVDTYLIIPEEVNNMRIRAYVYDTKPILLAKRGMTDRLTSSRRITLFKEEIMSQLLDTDPKEVIDWLTSNRGAKFKSKVSAKFYKKYIDSIESNYKNFYIQNLLKEDHSPEFIDAYIRHDFEKWRVVASADYKLTEDQISFLVTEYEKKAAKENNEQVLRKFLNNLKSCVHSYSKDLVLKHPNLIYGCADFSEDLFDKIYDRVTTLNAATLIYNRTEQDHIKLFLKLKFG